MKGSYPAILDDEKSGVVARALFADAQAMLTRIVEEKWLTARASIGFWPAESEGEDIVLYTDQTRKTRLATFHTLRQQVARERQSANLALSDFVAPACIGTEDYVGGFVVTTGFREGAAAGRFKAGQGG